MNARNLLLCILCFSLTVTGCGRRRQQNEVTQLTLPAPAVATEVQLNVPTTAPEQPTLASVVATSTNAQAVTQPTAPAEPLTTTPPPAPTATVISETDPLGDEIEDLLGQLDDANTAADKDIQNLPNP